jgi:arylsulfatase A-like enzyme
LIVVLDACRADKLSCYGFNRATTPYIDQLADDANSVVFGRHYAQSTWTKPSTASLFTGLLPYQHGINRKYRQVQGGRFETQILAAEIKTLAEELQELGYSTFAVARNLHLSAVNGFAQGFSAYHDPETIRGDRGALRIFTETLRQARGKVFGYLHVMACHNPFPPRRRSSEYLTAYGFDYDEAARKKVGIDFTGSGLRQAIRGRRITFDEADVRFLHLVYEAMLHQVDARIVRVLLEGIRSSGRYDNALIILTADHGEELYDHGGYAHMHALWEEVIRVPLIVKFPANRKPRVLPRDVTEITSSVDLYPSILALLDSAVSRNLPGRDIFHSHHAPAVLSEGASEMRNHEWALIRANEKLIETSQGPLLFGLLHDPTESTNLASKDPAGVRRMRALAEKLRKRHPPWRKRAPVVEIDLPSSAIERMKKLGY